MIALALGEVAHVVGGVLHGPADLVVDGPAYLDSRAPVPGGLFVAIAGERTDGHAHAAGAHAVLGSRPTEAPTVVVADPVTALGRLARLVVGRLDVPVTALTGSQGKTGTKDLLAHVLAGLVPAEGAVVATAGNLNNELGVPLTVLRADHTTRHLVVEMGARGVGHIAYLCELAPPRVAGVLNVGTAHLGEFGGVEAIARAKGEIVEALPDDGTAVLNADDPRVAAMARRTTARVLTFGHGGDVSWRGVTLDDVGRARFELGHDGGWEPVALRVSGAHQVPNAAAAGALALAHGAPLAQVAAGLSEAEPASRWRMEVTRRRDGLVVVNDAYNANPDSMSAALDALRELAAPPERRSVAVLGEMLELGVAHEAAHEAVGAAAAGVDVVVVVGEAAAGIGTGARAAGVGVVVLTASRSEAAAWVRENTSARDVVLVKASRGAALETVAEELSSVRPPTEPAAEREGGQTAR